MSSWQATAQGTPSVRPHVHSRILLSNFPQANSCSVCYGNRKFITVFTTAPTGLYHKQKIQCIQSQAVSLRFVLILSNIYAGFIQAVVQDFRLKYVHFSYFPRVLYANYGTPQSAVPLTGRQSHRALTYTQQVKL
jgi:hypothetical protein